MDEADGGEDPELDDFDRLRSIREQHRREKYLQKLMARSISAQQVTTYDIIKLFKTVFVIPP